MEGSVAERVLLMDDALGRKGENPPLRHEGLWAQHLVHCWGSLGGKMVPGQWLLGLSTTVCI